MIFRQFLKKTAKDGRNTVELDDPMSENLWRRLESKNKQLSFSFLRNVKILSRKMYDFFTPKDEIRFLTFSESLIASLREFCLFSLAGALPV